MVVGITRDPTIYDRIVSDDKRRAVLHLLVIVAPPQTKDAPAGASFNFIRHGAYKMKSPALIARTPSTWMLRSAAPSPSVSPRMNPLTPLSMNRSWPAAVNPAPPI